MIWTFAFVMLAAQPGPAVLAIGSCAAERTTPVDRQNLTAVVQQAQSPTPALIERLRGNLASCTPANAAPPGDGTVAAITIIAHEVLGRNLAAGGLDPELIGRWFERQGDALKTNLQVTQEQGEALGRDLIAAGATEASVSANSGQIGGYLGTLIMIERLRRGLPPTQ